MALIDEHNLHIYLSGGTAVPDDTYAHLSLGGARSVAEMGTIIGNLFPEISIAQALYGVVLHRCVYFRNEDPNTAGLLDAVAYIGASTPNASTEVDIGLAPEGLNGVAELLTDGEETPTDVTFSHPADFTEGIALPTPLVQNDQIPIWVRLTVAAEATMEQIDHCLLACVGRTEEPA